MRELTVHGEKLRALRVTTGARMQEVASAVGCSKRHLQMIETAGRQPSDELAYRLVHTLTRLHGRPVSVTEFTSPACPLRPGRRRSAAEQDDAA
jgi:transcriptional regulator with XRE-family HTH domain